MLSKMTILIISFLLIKSSSSTSNIETYLCLFFFILFWLFHFGNSLFESFHFRLYIPNKIECFSFLNLMISFYI